MSYQLSTPLLVIYRRHRYGSGVFDERVCLSVFCLYLCVCPRSYLRNCKVLCPTRHKIGHSEMFFPANLLARYWKKPKPYKTNNIKLHVQFSPNYSALLPMAVARFCSDAVAIRDVLPVLWMTSYLHVVCHGGHCHVCAVAASDVIASSYEDWCPCCIVIIASINQSCIFRVVQVIKSL